MKVIRISERSREHDGIFEVIVAFGEDSEYSVKLTDPADGRTEPLLSWYFEEHLRFPFLDIDKNHDAVATIVEYGKALFAQVFGGPANHDYRKLRDRSFDNCRLEISGSAVFHLLHWEALRDAELDAPLAVLLPVTRRVGLLPSKFKLPARRDTLNILLVTARPFGQRDIGYRTISRPLIDGIRQSKLPVTIDFVRPGTWRAFREHLQSAKERYMSGWYHVIHFDVHGGFSEFAEMQRQLLRDRFLLQSMPVKPFDGRQPFLYFETTDEGTADLIPAEAIASLLSEHRIPVAILNACQSARQVDREASLALQLVQAGVPIAVGMAYSVTVSAAVQAITVLYQRLIRGADPIVASHAARRSLYEYQSREAYFDQQIDLEDWMLPVVFRQRPFKLRLAPMDDTARANFYHRQSDIGSEPSTEYGFVGRDLDIQAIERQLLAGPDTNELLLQGMAGVGKSTLVRHLAWWWQRTGLIEGAFQFSYEDRAWTCSQIVDEINSRLLIVGEASAGAMSDSARLEQIAHRLRASRHLLILDNAEYIAAASAAIPHSLNVTEQAELKTLLSRLRGGETLVIVGSREAESWLAQECFADNTYTLPGLDAQAASTLLERILRRNSATHWLHDEAERTAIQDLVTLLQGYPLAMTVVLPVLATTAPSVVLAELRVGESSADPEGLIIRAVEYSYDKLSPILRHSLLLLAPFTSVVPTGPVLDEYQALLVDAGTEQTLGKLDLAAAVAEAVAVGLANRHPRFSNMLQVQPVLPYFLRHRLLQYDNLHAMATQAHYEEYYRLGGFMFALLTSQDDPDSHSLGKAVIEGEYANLTAALAYGLRTAQPVSDLIKPLEEYLDREKQQAARYKLLGDAIASYPEPTDSSQQRELALLYFLVGNSALDRHRPSEAKGYFEAELHLRQEVNDKAGEAWAYRSLGMVARTNRQFDEAEINCRNALNILLEMDDRRNTAKIYHQLGLLAQVQRLFAEAEELYLLAVEIELEFEDLHDMAFTYNQLGTLAREQRRLAEAEANHLKALKILIDFDDRHSIGSTYYDLGIVAYEHQRLEEAQAYFRKALKTRLEFGDQYGAALTYHELGIVFQDQRRFDEAKANYRKALDLKCDFGDKHSAAITYQQLGAVALEQRRFDEAEASYRSALEIFLELNDGHRAAGTYNQLGVLAYKQEQFDNAQASYQLSLKIFLELNDRQEAANVLYNLRVLAAAAGDADEMYNLGNILTEQHMIEEAEQLFLRAAEKGHAAAMCNLGIIYYKRDDIAAAEQWLRRAVEKDHDLAMMNLGAMLLDTKPDEAERWMRRAVQTGNPDALYNLGYLLETTDRSEEAEHWYRLAANTGHGEALFRISLLTHKVSPAEAEQWWRRSAEAGNASAKSVLGALAFDASDLDEAQHWWWLAADAGEASAIQNLQTMLRAMDAATAEHLCRQAAEAGHAVAMGWLALIIRKTQPAEAEQWLQRAAECGNVDAIYNLGVVLKETGRIDEARQWWLKASALGDFQAKYNLGVLLHLTDPAKAEKLYRQAADAGHARAMRNLAALLQETDPAEAEKWSRRATETN